MIRFFVQISLLLFVLSILGCNCGEKKLHPNFKLPKNKVLIDSAEIKSKEWEAIKKLDSIRYDKILKDLIADLKGKSTNKSFKDSLKIEDENLGNITVIYNYDFHFSKSERQLIVHRYGPGDTYIDIFAKTKDGYSRLVNYKHWSLEYSGDTIHDVNGDGLKDFVVNWYGSNGCCLKAFSDVHLARSDYSSFTESIEFINPTFSPKEGVIRGVEYGHPGETEIYKYKWKGESYDTLEYVHFQVDKEGKKTGNVVISNFYPYHEKYKVLRLLKSAPKEYQSIYGYDWFMGKF